MDAVRHTLSERLFTLPKAGIISRCFRIMYSSSSSLRHGFKRFGFVVASSLDRFFEPGVLWFWCAGGVFMFSLAENFLSTWVPGVMTLIGVPTPLPPIGGGDFINVFDNFIWTLWFTVDLIWSAIVETSFCRNALVFATTIKKKVNTYSKFFCQISNSYDVLMSHTMPLCTNDKNSKITPRFQNSKIYISYVYCNTYALSTRYRCVDMI